MRRADEEKKMELAIRAAVGAEPAFEMPAVPGFKRRGASSSDASVIGEDRFGKRARRQGDRQGGTPDGRPQ